MLLSHIIVTKGGVMSRAISLAAFMAVLLLSATSAAAEDSVERLTSNPSNAVLAEDWGTSIMDDIEEYLQSDDSGNHRGWQLGLHENNPGGGYIGSGQAMIQADPADIRYGRARAAAYYTAYTNAVADFARALSASIATETVNRSFRDELGADLLAQDAKSTDNLLKALRDRMSTMSVAVLDRGLKTLGADPEELPAYSRNEKRLMAQNMLARTVIVETARKIRGVRVLATFEDNNEIGVLIVHHPRLEHLANKIVSGRAAGPKSGNVDAIRKQIEDLESEELILQHGIRVIADSEGIPVILSFGQSSPAVNQSDSDRRIRMAISQSRQVAEMQADGAIAEFVNSTVFASSELDELAIDSQHAEQVGRQVLYQESSSFYEDLNTMIRQAARAEVSGVTTIRRWQANSPHTGHLYTGVVRMWTPAQSFNFSGQPRDSGISAGAASAQTEESGDKKAEKRDRGQVRKSRDLLEGDW